MGSQQLEEEYVPPPRPSPLPVFLPSHPPFMFNLSRGELQRRQRLIDEALRLRGYSVPLCGGGGIRDPKLENDPTFIIDCVNRALGHYNANNPDAEFEPVKALMYSSVAFRRARWVHVSFLARRRSTEASTSPAMRLAEPAADDPNVNGGRKHNKAPAGSPDEQFFAELRYDSYDSATVVTCRIIEKTPHGFKTKCEFCPASFEILHPGDGKFVCGKRSQRNEFYTLRNRFRKPYTWPKKEAEKEPYPESPLGWCHYALDIFKNILTKVFVVKLWPG